eukprot:32440-Eustigmatos_ZCMA.PRE.1
MKATILSRLGPSLEDFRHPSSQVGYWHGMCWLCGSSILARTPYPLDARLVLLAVAAVALCLYISSLSLQ